MINRNSAEFVSDIAQEIVLIFTGSNGLVAQAEAMKQGDHGWTVVTFESLFNLMSSKLNGYVQYCRPDKLLNFKGKKEAGLAFNEFMWDLSWQKRGSDKNIKDLYLVCECEWCGDIDIQQDFQKLMVARSKIYLMVFQGDDSFVAERINCMKTTVENSSLSNSGDIWILSGYCWQSHKFMVKYFVVNDC